MTTFSLQHSRCFFPFSSTFLFALFVIACSALVAHGQVSAVKYDRQEGVSRVFIPTQQPVIDYRLLQDSSGRQLSLALTGQGVADGVPVRYQVEDTFFRTIHLEEASGSTQVRVELKKELDQMHFRVVPHESEHGLVLLFSNLDGGISDYVPSDTVEAFDIDMFEGAYTMIFSLLVVLVLFAIVVWFMRRLSGRQLTGGTTEIRVISRTPIGPKKHILVVEVFDETILLGEWDDGLCYMKTIEDEKTLGKIRLHDRKVHANFSSYLKRAVVKNSVSGLTHNIKHRMETLRGVNRDDQKS